MTYLDVFASLSGWWDRDWVGGYIPNLSQISFGISTEIGRLSQILPAYIRQLAVYPKFIPNSIWDILFKHRYSAFKEDSQWIYNSVTNTA